MGNYLKDKAWRLKLYSIFFCWASMIQTAFYIGSKVSVDHNFYKQGWFLGVIAICLQSIFVILVRKYNFLENSSPIETGFLKRINDQIQNKYNKYMYYTLFTCIGFFIYASFNKSFISVLWLLEAFFIYIVGIIHKDKALRMLSIFFLLFCVLRMIMIDLEGKNLLIKSAVFFLSGIIIILVNMIYKSKVLKNEN